jgi:hypothetical protein
VKVSEKKIQLRIAAGALEFWKYRKNNAGCPEKFNKTDGLRHQVHGGCNPPT